MKIIKTTKDLRFAYGLLRVLGDDPDGIACALDTKAAIREYHRRNRRPNARVVRADGDSILLVQPLPERLQTAVAADDYFCRRYLRESRPSLYDCTGQVFTNWYKIFERAGQFWAYHSMSIDV